MMRLNKQFLNKQLKGATLIGVAVLFLGACATGGAGQANHPDELVFGDRELTFLDREDYRYELPGGDVMYLVTDRALPLVKMRVYSRAGNYLLGDLPAGSGGLTASMLRDGGAGELKPADLDERLDFLATNVSFSIGNTGASASLDSLSSNFGESLNLMMDMLVAPQFDEERLRIAVDRQVEAMRRRNDDTRSIEPRVWSQLMLGEDFFATRVATQASVESINPDVMRDVVGRIFGRGDLVIAVSGDIDADTARAALGKALARLPEASELPSIPDTLSPGDPGVYTVFKDDVNQTRVTVGLPGPRVNNPDEFAIAVMNDILGGGGFTSRITSRVRSDEGLAYSAGSRFQLGRHYDGQFRAFFQSKNASVPQALAIVLEEVERIRTAPVTEQELSTAIESRLAFLADLYASAESASRRFAADEINSEPADRWRTYEANIRKVSIADVQRVAEKYLDPAQLRILLVGKIDEALAGDGNHGTVESVTGKTIRAIALKDPLTQQPLADAAP
ncbi:MAG: pitrilysin family protein [Pseudomonadota bacterium]